MRELSDPKALLINYLTLPTVLWCLSFCKRLQLGWWGQPSPWQVDIHQGTEENCAHEEKSEVVGLFHHCVARRDGLLPGESPKLVEASCATHVTTCMRV